MTAGATESAPTIAHQGKVKYIGIPNGFTATVYETNDVTGTTYKSEGTADTAAAAKNIVWTGEGAKSNTAATTAATDVTKAVDFTNTLEIISPTGVVLRFAPYIAMLVAGVALFIILGSKRRKNNDD